METNEVLSATATIGKEVYLTKLEARTHRLDADEPIDAGGKDLGPRPGDFVRMGLASCTAITLRMYANRKNFDVQQIQVRVSNGPFEGKTVFSSEIQIVGTLSEEQQSRMLQIARLCPVHKVLTNPIEIETHLSTVTSATP